MSYLRYFICLRIVSLDSYCIVFCFVFLRFVCHMLLVSLDFQFVIVHSVFSNVYFTNLVVKNLFKIWKCTCLCEQTTNMVSSTTN